jgi:hypothetical protein
MSSESEVLAEFKKQLLSFFDELIGQFPREGDLVIARVFIATQIPIKELMENFIHKISTNNQELKKMIKSRNETFFLQYSLFEDIDRKEKLNHFKKIWRSEQLDKEDKDVIWNWIDAFVFLSEKYMKAIQH